MRETITRIVLFVFLVALACPAQRPGGGANLPSATAADPSSFEVQVSLPHGAIDSTLIKVEVLSLSRMPMAEAYTNREGKAEFSTKLNFGKYLIRVSGPGIQTVTTGEIEIIRGERVHREFVTVTPVPQPAVDTKGPATVSAQSLDIPENARAEFSKGMDAYENGKMDDAKQDFQKAISIYPKYAHAFYNLGILYTKTNDPAKAREEFSKAVEVDPNFAPAYVKLAEIFTGEQNYKDAEAQLNKAEALEPSALNVLVMLSSVEYANQEFDKALADARRVHNMPRHEQYADVHLVAGEILLKRNSAQEAITEFEAFCSESPNDPRVAQVKALIAKLQSSAN